MILEAGRGGPICYCAEEANLLVIRVALLAMVYLKCPDVCPGMTIVQLHILWSVMLLCMIVKLVELVDRIEMRKTDCFGKTRLVRTCLAHHEL